MQSRCVSKSARVLSPARSLRIPLCRSISHLPCRAAHVQTQLQGVSTGFAVTSQWCGLAVLSPFRPCPFVRRCPPRVQCADLHSRAAALHGRHGHEHEHEEHGEHEHEEDEEEEDGEGKESATSAPPTRAVDKVRMEAECTRITVTGVYSNIFLALFKFAGGIMGNSMAMIADAAHSLSDLVTDGITLWAARLTHKPQDADHPYGHGKFEAVGSLTISATLAVTAGGIAWSAVESIQTIYSGEALSVPTGIALVAAVVSIAVKEVLYHMTLRVGTRWNSKVVKANAWHHRSDSISTLVAMVGVVGAMVKMPILDPIAVGSSRVDLQACKLEYSIVSPK